MENALYEGSYEPRLLARWFARSLPFYDSAFHVEHLEASVFHFQCRVMAPSSAAAIDVIRFGFVEIVNAFHERIGIKDIKKYGSADVSFGVFRRLAHIEYHGSSVTLHGFLIFFNWQDCYSVIGMATDTKSQCRQKGCNLIFHCSVLLS